MIEKIKNFLSKLFTNKNPNVFNYKDFIKNMKKKNKGLMSKNQYLAIAKELNNLSPCNLLVFGLGDDSYLWNSINKGGVTIFLEDNIEWINSMNDGSLKVEHVTYKTLIENQKDIGFIPEKLELPLSDEVLNYKYDFIIVDAPLGHQPPRPLKGPGRMSSIFMASKLIKKNGIAVIDDMGRPIERRYAFHFFGQENLIKFIENKVGIFKK